MYTNPKSSSCIDFIIMESNIDKIFIDNLNKKIDELRLNKNKVSASDRLVGQIKKGEQLNLCREIKIFDQVHKLGEIMAEKYTSEYFVKAGFKNIYTGAKCIDLWSVHQFSGDYNPIHNHAAGETGLSFIFWTKVPDRMRNINASDLYSSSGKENGCTTFVGNSNGNFFDFKPLNSKVYIPKVGHFLIFPNWLNHMVYPFSCDGERRTVAGNIVLYKSKIEKNDDKYDHRVSYFDQGNPLKWKICQDI